MFDDTAYKDIVKLNGVGQTYDEGKSWIIDGLNLRIEDDPRRGQFVCVLGASGCGKSHILRYISGLQQPSKGEVIINGVRQHGQIKIGMVFQKYSSLPWYSVLDNVALGLKIRGVSQKERYERARELINEVGLRGQEEKYAQYPTLSGGQLQRVAIARNLMVNPQIILMDEPFSGLDVNTKAKMQDLLLDMYHKHHMTVIFVTHDVSEAVYLADEIWTMDANPGRIVNRYHVNLPRDRDRTIKREMRFVRQVQEMEDFMIQLEAK